MYDRQRLIARIGRDLEAFLDEPPQVRRAVLLWIRHNRPQTFQRLRELLHQPPDQPDQLARQGTDSD